MRLPDQNWSNASVEIGMALQMHIIVAGDVTPEAISFGYNSVFS